MEGKRPHEMTQKEFVDATEARIIPDKAGKALVGFVKGTGKLLSKHFGSLVGGKINIEDLNAIELKEILHRAHVIWAINEGERIAPAVLEDYPDIVALFPGGVQVIEEIEEGDSGV